MTEISPPSLAFLDAEHRRRVNELLRSGVGVMPHQLAVKAGLTYRQALLIIVALQSRGLGVGRILIYHVCDPDVWRDAIPLGQGLPRLPWRCPECESEVEDVNDLLVDVDLVLSADVCLV